MEDENDILKLLERSSIEGVTGESLTNDTSGCTSNQGIHGGSLGSIDTTHSYQMDELPTHLACLAANDSASEDCGSYNLVNSVSDATRQEQLHPVSSAHEPGHEAQFEFTEDFKFPSPPKDSPPGHDQADNSAVSATASSQSNTSLDRSYLRSCSENSDLPSWRLDKDEERFIWPLQDEFSVKDQFEENLQYRLSANIAGGAFGKCYVAAEVSADDTVEGRVFCVKMCEYRENELLALKLAKKENIAEIIEFYGAKIKGKDAWIFMEFMPGGTIADYIQDIKDANSANDVHMIAWPIISEIDSLWYLEDILKAVKFLQSKGIVHRDIKGENVLMEQSRLRVKLIDFGSAEGCTDEHRSNDIWKTGCLALEMLNGERPSLFAHGGILQRQNSCRPEDHIPSQAMQDIKELLRFCFGLKTPDQNFLPTAAEILRKSDAFPVTELLKRLNTD